MSTNKAVFLGALAHLVWGGIAVPQETGFTPENRFSLQDHMKSWAETRDDNIIKQRFDYSCGAAALATILNTYYGEDIDEISIIKSIGIKEAFSFADLSLASAALGYKAVPIKLRYELLEKLKAPVILFIDSWGDGHFTVLKGADGDTVWLGDPAWGNTYLSKNDFLKKWTQETQQIKSDTNDTIARTGYALAIIKLGQSINPGFFGLDNAAPKNYFLSTVDQMEALFVR